MGEHEKTNATIQLESAATSPVGRSPLAVTCDDSHKTSDAFDESSQYVSPRMMNCSDSVHNELENRLKAILALRNLCIKQRETVARLRQKVRDQKERITNLRGQRAQNTLPTDTLEVGESSLFRKRAVSFGPTVERTDEQNSILQELGGSTWMENMTQELRNSISSIQEQASEIDSVIALDELLSAKMDLKASSKALEAKDVLIKDLKAQLREKDLHIGSLKMERDLFEADATVAKEQLKVATTLTDFPTANKTEMERDLFEANATVAKEQLKVATTLTDFPTENKTEMERDLFEADATVAKEQLKTATKLTGFPTENKTEMDNPVKDDEATERQHGSELTLPALRLPTQSNISSRLNIRFHHNVKRPLLPNKKRVNDQVLQSGDSGDTAGMSDISFPGPRRGAMDSRIRWFRQRNRDFVDNDPSFVKMDEVASPVTLSRKQLGQLQEGGSDRQAETDNLHDQLEASIEETNELRERLGQVMTFYEAKVRSLITDNAQLKQEKLHIKSDMNHMVNVAVEEKEQAINRMQTKMRLKDSLIFELRKMNSADMQRRECLAESGNNVDEKRY